MRSTIQQRFMLHAMRVASVLVAGLALPVLPALAADDRAQLALGTKLFLQGVVPS